MATSQEIAQQIADQNSWFLQQSALASQIGQDPMAFRQGGGYFGGSVPVMPQHPGMIGSPGAFSYNQGESGGYAFGNAMGRIGTAALGAAPIAATGLVEAGAAATGLSSPLTNPFAAFGMARAAGFGIGGALGVTGLSMLPAAYAGFAMNQVVGGSRQQASVNTALSQYNFANRQAVSGQGFSRQDALAISSRVRQLGQIPELLTSFEEITRLLPMMKQSGVMNGVRDAGEFNKRMKETITTLRDVSKILGSTMEEAGEFFVHSRRVGFLGRQAQLQNTLNARTTMSATGMNQSQEMAMAETAAAFGTAIGGNRRISVLGAQRLATSIGLTVRNDPRMMETLTNMTGKEDPGAAAADASIQLLNRGISVMGSGVGRYILAGMSKFNDDGTVDIDEDRMRDFLVTGDRHAVGRRASGLMGSHKNVIAFERNQTRLAQKAIAAGGLEGFAKLMQGALGTNTDAALMVMQKQFGFTEEQTDLIKAMLDKGTAGMEQEKLDIESITARNAARMERTPGALWTRLKTRMRNTFAEGLRQTGAEINSRIGRYFDEMYEDFFDDAVIKISEKSREEFASAFALGTKDFGKPIDMAAYTRISTGPATLSKKFADSEIGRFLKFGGNERSTGMTADAARRDMSDRIFAHSNATQEQVNQVVEKMKAGEISPVLAPGVKLENLSTNEQFYAKHIGDTRRRLMLEDSFAYADPDKQRQRLEREVEMSIRPGMALFGSAQDKAIWYGRQEMRARGGGKVDPFTAGAVASDQLPENLRNQIGVEGEKVLAFSPHELTLKKRKVNEGFRAIYGEDMGDQIQKDSALQAKIISAKKLVGPDKDDLIAAGRGGKGSEEALKRVNATLAANDIKPFTKEDARRVVEAEQAARKTKEDTSILKTYNIEGHTIEKLKDMNDTITNTEDREWSKALVSQASNTIDLDNVDERIGKEMGALKKSMADYGATGDKDDLDPTKMRDSFTAVYKKLSGIKDPKERGKVLKTAGAGISAGYARYRESEEELAKAQKSGSKMTVAQLAKKLGIKPEEALTILRAEGYGAADQVLSKPISADAASALQQASTGRSAAQGLTAGANDATTKNKENAQMIFFKTMTDALIAIASGDKTYKAPTGKPGEALKNASETALAGAKG